MTAVLERLKKLDACAVSDAMDSLGLPPAVSDIRRLSTDRTIAGVAVTVRLGTDKPQGGPVRHLGSAAIETSGPGTVIVVEQRTGLDAGGWGGVLSSAAVVKGCEGVIVEGPSRDIDEARMLGFPVFARRTTARTARGRVYEQETGGEVRIGEVTVASGDFVIADDSGIVFVPAARIDQVLAAAERIAARERLMVAALRRGDAPTQVMGADYEDMLNQIRGREADG